MNSGRSKVAGELREKKLRRRRIFAVALLVLLVWGIAWFVSMRRQDLTAWPERAAEVSLAVDMKTYVGMRLASPNDVAGFTRNLFHSAEDLLTEYRRFQTLGMAEGQGYPLIEQRLGNGASNLVAFAEFWSLHDGFDPSCGSTGYNEFIGYSAEFAVLGCYYAAAGVTNGLLPTGHDGRISMLVDQMRLTRGGGLLARASALNNVMLVVREIIMNPEEQGGDTAVLEERVARLRELEDDFGDLGDAIRADYASVRGMVSSLYGQLAGKPQDQGSGARLGGMSGIMVGMLGGNEVDTQAHLGALFSRLIRHSAAKGYTQEGLSAGLPGWVGLKKERPPWTRDPIGAAVAVSYMQNANFAHAVEPSVVLELRAARIVLALQFYRHEQGEYPGSLDALLDGGLLVAGDVEDPFATDVGTRLVYSRDGDGWRFHSVGLNQVDDGGIYDAYRVKTAKEQMQADFVFVSRERETRSGSNGG